MYCFRMVCGRGGTQKLRASPATARHAATSNNVHRHGKGVAGTVDGAYTNRREQGVRNYMGRNRGSTLPAGTGSRDAGAAALVPERWLFPESGIRAHEVTPGPSIERRTMEQYIGLDLPLKETAISVRQNGKRIWRGKCPSNPQLLAEVIRKRAPNATRVRVRDRPVVVWFYPELMAEGLPSDLYRCRHAKAALDMRRTRPMRRCRRPLGTRCDYYNSSRILP